MSLQSLQEEFSLAIAGLNVGVRCKPPQLAQILQDRYSDFSQSGKPSILNVEIEWDGHDRKSSLLDTNTVFQEGIVHFTAQGYRGFIDEFSGKGQLQLSSVQPVEEIDYYLRVVFSLLAHRANGILFHAAGIIREGYAHLFFGHSGSGKTTVCRVSAETHTILNDDLILLMPEGDAWQAYGTPFWNPTQVKPTPQSAPVKAMYRLTQAKLVSVRELAASQAIAAMFANVPIIPQDPVRSMRLLDTLTKIQGTVPVQELLFLPDDTFWNVIPS
jgi:hypothetical protein